MPRLSSKTADRFFENTGEALTRASHIHNKNPFEGMRHEASPPPQLPTRSNQDPSFLTDAIGGAGADTSMIARNIGNSSNIVIDPPVLTQTINRADKIDDYVGSNTHTMLNDVEEICATIFQLPETVQEIKGVYDDVKHCLGPFRGVTDGIAMTTRRFAYDMSDIDHGNLESIAMSQRGTDQAVQMARTSINRQADNMERTASTYRNRADRLEQQAEREERAAENFQRQLDMLASVPNIS